MASPVVTEYMAHTGWDWLLVDMEHNPVSFETVWQCFQAICTTDTIPMVRVAANDYTLIKRALDAGALGVVVPMINSRTEAERAIDSMKFPPMGKRSFGGGRALLYGRDYFAKANDEILVALMIEHIDAVQCAEEILSVGGIDMCLIGTGDLAGSMGLNVTADEPDHSLENVINGILQVCKKMKVAAGIFVDTAEEAIERIQQGFQFIPVATDAMFMRETAANTLLRIKEAQNKKGD